jgi:hypothetical protein
MLAIIIPSYAVILTFDLGVKESKFLAQVTSVRKLPAQLETGRSNQRVAELREDTRPMGSFSISLPCGGRAVKGQAAYGYLWELCPPLRQPLSTANIGVINFLL